MMSSGGAEMATRMQPQVLEMLQSSNLAGLTEEGKQIIMAKRAVKLHAYRVLQQMSAFTRVSFPLSQLLEDAR